MKTREEILASWETEGETLEVRDFVSGKNVKVNVESQEDIDEGTLYCCTYSAQASNEVDCRFAVIETSDGTMMCQTDWQSICATPDTIADFEWEDCTPRDDFEDMLDVAETAEMLDVSRQRVHQLLQAGQLDGRKVGKTWYVYRYSIDNRMAKTSTCV